MSEHGYLGCAKKSNADGGTVIAYMAVVFVLFIWWLAS